MTSVYQLGVRFQWFYMQNKYCYVVLNCYNLRVVWLTILDFKLQGIKGRSWLNLIFRSLMHLEVWYYFSSLRLSGYLFNLYFLSVPPIQGTSALRGMPVRVSACPFWHLSSSLMPQDRRVFFYSHLTLKLSC